MTKALIIDDSSTVRSIIAKILVEQGIENAQAGNGLEAFQKLNSNPDVTVALVDWNMPVVNGLQFIKMVRAEEKFNSVKLIMVTTETELPRITAALEAGVDEYIMKPFNKEDLLEKLAMVGVISI